MNTTGKNSLQESKPKMTAATLMRLAGLSAVVTGLCFILIGMFHQLNIPSSVTTATWMNVHIFAVALGFFGLFGMAGLYARQVEKSGWMALAGFLLLSVWMTLVSGFSFVEAFILPQLAITSPKFVIDILGMFSGAASETDLGVLPMLWNLSGPMYIVGPLLFGIATFRAGVLPRWAGALLALGAVLIPIGALVPPEYQSAVAMVPVGFAFVWLGYALFSERREKTAESLLGLTTAKPELRNAA